MRAEILKLHRRIGSTTVYVTHDQAEAMSMGDRIAVLNLGALQQVGTAEELYTRPAQRLRRPVHRLARDERRGGGRDRRRRGYGAAPRSPGAQHVRLGDGRGDARPASPAQVEVVEYLGDEQLAHLRVGDASLLATDR